jgi:hypothetical protein
MAQKGNALYLGNQYGKDASSVHDEEGRLWSVVSGKSWRHCKVVCGGGGGRAEGSRLLYQIYALESQYWHNLADGLEYDGMVTYQETITVV